MLFRSLRFGVTDRRKARFPKGDSDESYLSHRQKQVRHPGRARDTGALLVAANCAGRSASGRQSCAANPESVPGDGEHPGFNNLRAAMHC